MPSFVILTTLLQDTSPLHFSNKRVKLRKGKESLEGKNRLLPHWLQIRTVGHFTHGTPRMWAYNRCLGGNFRAPAVKAKLCTLTPTSSTIWCQQCHSLMDLTLNSVTSWCSDLEQCHILMLWPWTVSHSDALTLNSVSHPDDLTSDTVLLSLCALVLLGGKKGLL